MKQWEDYVLDNGVLKNKLHITNQDELYEVEKRIVTEKLSLLILNPYIGKFDSNHLKEIHRYLFKDIYDFAGEFREVNIYKKESAFLDYNLIEEKLNELLKNAKELEINDNNKFTIARFLGDFYYQLILIHPFREGNGRTIREFLREFTNYKFNNYELEYSRINKENFLLGVTERDTYPLLLAYEINNALVEINIKKK